MFQVRVHGRAGQGVLEVRRCLYRGNCSGCGLCVAECSVGAVPLVCEEKGQAR